MWVKVLNLDEVPDSTGEVIWADGVTLPEGDVPVQYNFSTDAVDHMGYAKLERREDGVYADITLLPRDKDNAPACYPAVCGVTFDRSGPDIKKCAIRSIGLSLSKNADPRIKTLEEQSKA